MKTKVSTAMLVAATLCLTPLEAEVLKQEVDVVLGPKAFRSGDVVRIDEVTSTSKRMEVDDKVTVRGKYRLRSEEFARLCLFLTTNGSHGCSEVEKAQTIEAVQGWHEFELTTTVKAKGVLHITFYSSDSGRPIGGVYFGTSKQISESSWIRVDHYITES